MTDSKAERNYTGVSLIKGGGAAFLGRTLGTFLQYVSNIVLARSFGVDFTGRFALGLAVVNIATSISRIGLDMTLVRYVAAYRSLKQSDYLKGVLLWSFGAGVLCAMLMAVILRLERTQISQWIRQPELEDMILIMAWLIPGTMLIILGAGALQGAKRIMQMTLLRDVGVPATVLIALAPRLFWQADFHAVLWVMVVSTAILGLIGLWMVWREFRQEFNNQHAAMQAASWLRFSLPITISSIFIVGNGWIDRLLLGKFTDTTQVGIYFAAQKTSLLIVLILAAANSIFSPVAAELWHKQDHQSLERVHRLSTRAIWVVTLPLCVVMAILRQPLMSVFGAEFAAGGNILLIMLIGVFFNAATGNVGQLLMMTDNQRIALIDSILALLLTFGSLFWAIPRYGMIGAAAGIAFSTTLINMLKSYQVWRLIGIQPYDKSYLPPLLSALAAAGAGWVLYRSLQEQNMLLASTLILLTIVIIYMGGWTILGLEKEDRAAFQLVVTKFKVIFAAFRTRI